MIAKGIKLYHVELQVLTALEGSSNAKAMGGCTARTYTASDMYAVVMGADAANKVIGT